MRSMPTAPAPATNVKRSPFGAASFSLVVRTKEPSPPAASDGSCSRHATDGPEWDRPPIGYPITKVQVVAFTTQPVGAADPCAT